VALQCWKTEHGPGWYHPISEVGESRV